MLFNTLQYMLFLPIVLFLYWKTSGLKRLWVVVVASYYFYMSFLPVYGVLLLAMTSINWFLGNAIDQQKQKILPSEKSLSKRPDKLLLGLGLVINIGCLCYYKYTDFLLTNLIGDFNKLVSTFGFKQAYIPFDPATINIILPLGISFFVFEFIHYLVDIYKGNRPIKSFLEFTAFAAFFPSQISGPIKRYQDFWSQLRNPLPWSKSLFFSGMALIVQGLFKKVALADPIGSLINGSFASLQPLSAIDTCIIAIGFLIQLYCDFSGYTDIGIGSALLMGIKLPKNFDLPYLAQDLSDFWRRWHISLSFWFRDYVYIPLGGSANSTLLTWRNLFITMTLCGLWHGAAWHYVIFGCTQGIGLIVNREWKNLLKTLTGLEKIFSSTPTKVIACICSTGYFALCLLVFRAPDMSHSFNFLSSLQNIHMSSVLWAPIIKQGVLPVLAAYMLFWLASEFSQSKFVMVKAEPLHRIFGSPSVQIASWTAAAILMLALKPTNATPFIYFQF